MLFFHHPFAEARTAPPLVVSVTVDPDMHELKTVEFVENVEFILVVLD